MSRVRDDIIAGTYRKLTLVDAALTPYRAVGSTVVQIAKKVVGCKKVIGIAGGKEKCDW